MPVKPKIIKVVPDTNILLRGFLSHKNTSRLLINLARAGRIVIYGTPETFEEFKEKIRMERMKRYLEGYQTSITLLEANYSNLLNLVPVPDAVKSRRISVDPDDDIFFHLANQIGSKIIVSEDKKDVLAVNYKDIRTLSSDSFIEIYKQANAGNLY